MAISYLACMVLAASIYHLPPRVLPSIQAVEGGHDLTIRHNANGSEDFGVMQVNSLWLPALSQYTRLPRAAVQDRLTSQPCFNITAAAAILRLYLDQANGNLMLAIGDYHSHTPMLNRAYQIQVTSAASNIFEGGR